MESNDEFLMREICSRDEAAFELLYDRYSPLVFSLCLKILCRPADAEVVLSDVFWEIWQKPQRFDPQRGSVRTYLLTLARSRAIDRSRAVTSRAARNLELCQEQAGVMNDRQKAGSPVDAAVADEEKRLLQRAISELDDRQHAVLSLAYFEGLTHREIADRLQLPLGTVKSLIRSAIILLRRSLATLEGTRRW